MNTSTTRRAVMALAAGALIIAAGGACEVDRGTGAVAGAAPVQGVPVGPVPGPGAVEPEHRNPYHGDPVALAEGRRLFVRFNCAGCHGGHAGGGMGPSLRDPEWIYGSSDAKIHNSIAQGRAHGMPSWGTTLPDDYIWKLTAYIQSLRTSAEPQPPQ